MRLPPLLKDEASVLEAARSGDSQAFERLIAVHRPSLHAHSYRLLGSRHDADDALQETLIRAWRAISSFEGRSSVGAWLYRIATNASLDLIRRRRRVLESGGHAYDRLTEAPLTDETRPGLHRYELLGPQAANVSPEARYEQREGAELAFVAALRHLPSRPRAVLILREVLGFTAPEVADVLGSSPAAVNSALQRARSALKGGNLELSRQPTRPAARGPGRSDAVERFVDALERDDLEGMLESLHSSAAGEELG
jgi:RNA polymerase sigma-70 factor, ECF subfamily